MCAVINKYFLRQFVLLFMCVMGVVGKAQTDTLSLQFLALFQQEELILNQDEACQLAPCIESFKFFCGGITLFNQEEVVYEDEVAYHLIDAEVPSSMIINFPLTETLIFDRVEFLIGVDSVTSARAEFGGDLDPTTGMYWTWNSGYIHFRVEGMLAVSEEENQSFEYHLGGYSAPYSTIRQLSIECKSVGNMTIEIDLDTFLDRAAASADYRVMSESAAGGRLADEFPSIFKVSDGK